MLQNHLFCLILILNIAHLKGHLILIDNEVKLAELIVNDLSHDDFQTESIYYTVKATECSRKLTTRNNKNLEVSDFKADIQIYEGYNHNMAFMLNVSYRSAIEQNSTIGYEIEMFEKKYAKPICVQITSTNDGKMLPNRKFSLTLKDPKLFNSHRGKFILVSVHSLGKCSTDHLCSIAHSNIQTAEIHLPTYISETDNTCYKSGDIDNMCVYVYNRNLDKESSNSMLIIMSSIPEYIETALYKVKSFADNYKMIYAHRNEHMNGIVYKMVPMKNQYYSLTSSFIKPSATNKCLNDSFCYCENKCVKCYNDDYDIPVAIKINPLNASTLAKSPVCLQKPYSLFNNFNIRETLFNITINETHGYHYNDQLPGLCQINGKHKTQSHLYESTLMKVELKLHYSSHSLFNSDILNVKYKVSLTDISYSNISNSNHSTFHDELIIREHESIVFDKSTTAKHEYRAILTPIVESTICGSSCPYMISSRILCEPCINKEFKLIINNYRKLNGSKCIPLDYRVL